MMRTTGQKRAIKPEGNRKPVVRTKIEKAEPRFRDHPILDTVLNLQRSIGNRAVQQFTADQRIQRQGTGADYFQNSKESVRRYSLSKAGLERELKIINRIGNKAQKRKKQGEFLQKILDKIIGSDPFAQIKVEALQTNENAVTDWVDENDHNKGVQVVFNELVLTDPLESIVLTCLHESVHARHLKGGVPYRSFAIQTIYKDYLNTAAALSELDSYTMEAGSPYFPKLAAARQKHIKDLVKQYEREVKAGFGKMDTFRHASFQKQLKALFPKFTHIQAWLKSNPPPW